MDTPLVRRHPITTCSFRKSSPEAEDALGDCFESTDWNVLQESLSKDIEGVTNCTTDYLNFCMDIVVPTRTVRCFPNNKPWITSNVRNLLNKKKRVFQDGDQAELRHVQRELKAKLKEAKEEYRRKVWRWSRSCRKTTWRRFGMGWKQSQAARSGIASWKEMSWKLINSTSFITGLTIHLLRDRPVHPPQLPLPVHPMSPPHFHLHHKLLSHPSPMLWPQIMWLHSTSNHQSATTRGCIPSQGEAKAMRPPSLRSSKQTRLEQSWGE